MSDAIKKTEKNNPEDITHSCLEDLLKIKTKGSENVLKSFSFYLSSNKNYRYNMSYINDQIDNFSKTVFLIKKKKRRYKNICGNLSKFFDDYSIEIEFDNCFVYTYTTTSHSFCIKKELESFSIYNFPLNSTHLKMKIKETPGGKEEEFVYKVEKNLFHKIKTIIEEYKKRYEKKN